MLIRAFLFSGCVGVLLPMHGANAAPDSENFAEVGFGNPLDAFSGMGGSQGVLDFEDWIDEDPLTALDKGILSVRADFYDLDEAPTPRLDPDKTFFVDNKYNFVLDWGGGLGEELIEDVPFVSGSTFSFDSDVSGETETISTHSWNVTGAGLYNGSIEAFDASDPSDPEHSSNYANGMTLIFGSDVTGLAFNFGGTDTTFSLAIFNSESEQIGETQYYKHADFPDQMEYASIFADDDEKIAYATFVATGYRVYYTGGYCPLPGGVGCVDGEHYEYVLNDFFTIDNIALYDADFGFDDDSLEPVPLPAALPLMAGGLGVFGYLRSRRKKAAAGKIG